MTDDERQPWERLRRAGVPRPQRGVKGGYSFAREREEITALEVVELLNGPVGRDAEGVFAEAATAAPLRRRVDDGDIIERERRDAGAAMYYI